MAVYASHTTTTTCDHPPQPANYLLVEGQLKLIDFGIAKAIGGDTTSIARESQVRATLCLFVCVCARVCAGGEHVCLFTVPRGQPS